MSDGFSSGDSPDDQVDFHQISEAPMYSDRDRVGRAGEKDLQTYITDSRGNISSLIRRFHHMGEKDDEIFIALMKSFYNMLGAERKFGKSLEFFLEKASVCKWVHMKSSIAFLLGFLAVKTSSSGGLFGRSKVESFAITQESLDGAFLELSAFKRFEPAIEKLDILRYARIWTVQLLPAKVEPIRLVGANESKVPVETVSTSQVEDLQSSSAGNQSEREEETFLEDDQEEYFETEYI